MPLIKRKLKDGEHSTCDLVREKIRVLCEVDKETFYGDLGTPNLVRGFLYGLWIGCREDFEASKKMGE
jgi:hypothetical protein